MSDSHTRWVVVKDQWVICGQVYFFCRNALISNFIIIRMRKIFTTCLLSAFSLTLSINSSAQGLDYYLPDSISYDPAIPKPKDIIYHEVGEYHVTHDRLVNYMKAIAAAAPSRVKLETMGFTYERRPQVLLIITSPENHKRLEEIRQQHVQLTDPARSASLSIATDTGSRVPSSRLTSRLLSMSA